MTKGEDFTKYYLFVIASNLLCWMLAIGFCYQFFLHINYCLMAYTFGVRHALDADHISAIDNITRKFIEEKKDSRKVGMLFSIGHSSVVLALSVFVALIPLLLNNLDDLKKCGEIVGNCSSIFFLLLLSFFNIAVCTRLIRSIIKNENKSRGLFDTFFKNIYKSVSRNYSIYLIGVLFGLSFDSATEIALLGLASTNEISRNIGFILLMPLLFSAGMCLVDTGINQLSVSVCRQLLETKYQKLNVSLTAFIALTGIFIAVCEGYNFIATDSHRIVPVIAMVANYTEQHVELLGLVITFLLAIVYVIFKTFSTYFRRSV